VGLVAGSPWQGRRPLGSEAGPGRQRGPGRRGSRRWRGPGRWPGPGDDDAGL